jgi:hypothetical protein
MRYGKTPSFFSPSVFLLMGLILGEHILLAKKMGKSHGIVFMTGQLGNKIFCWCNALKS